MKKILFLFFISISLNAQSEEHRSGVDWLTDYDTALDKAKVEEKHLLVYFTGSDWCPPCKILKKDLFDTEEFTTLSTDYILLYVDLPRQKSVISSDQLLQNQKLLRKLNKRGVFPNLIVLDIEEKIVGELSGYNMDGNTKRHRRFLEKHGK